MTPEELAQALEALIIEANEIYLGQIGELETVLYRRLIATLKDLDLDQDGYIKQSAPNRKILAAAEGDFFEVVKSRRFVSPLAKYLSVIPKVDLLNAEYFQKVTPKFKANTNYMKQLRKETVASMERLILKEGVEVSIQMPLLEIINQGINTGASFDGLMGQVKEFVLGTEEGGRLKNYVRTLTRDALFNYSRAFQQSATRDLKLEFYFYSGGLMAKSRGFCIDRVDKFWHHKEIEQWAKEEWPGKRKGTTEASIFVYCGGYNCTHSLIPVDISIVPQFVIDRAIKNGYIKKAA